STVRPGPRSDGIAVANRATSTPFGTTTNTPPTRSRAKAAAASDTATLVWIRAATRRSAGAATSNRRDRAAPEWNVATTGMREASVANIDTLGVSGSWAWTTSGPNASIARRTRRRVAGHGEIGAFD